MSKKIDGLDREVRELIAKNDLRTALSKVIEFAEKEGIETLHTEAVMITNRLSTIEKNNIRGIASQKAFEVETRRIGISLIEILNTHKKNKPHPANSSPFLRSLSVSLILKILSVLAVIILVLFFLKDCGKSCNGITPTFPINGKEGIPPEDTASHIPQEDSSATGQKESPNPILPNKSINPTKKSGTESGNKFQKTTDANVVTRNPDKPVTEHEKSDTDSVAVGQIVGQGRDTTCQIHGEIIDADTKEPVGSVLVTVDKQSGNDDSAKDGSFLVPITVDFIEKKMLLKFSRNGFYSTAERVSCKNHTLHIKMKRIKN